MAYQLKEEQALQRRRLTGEAVRLAVQGRWEEACKLNRDIIEKFPNDVEAYNRFGKALTALGEFAQAKKAYLKAIELAPGNPIAKKNIARLDSLPEFGVSSNNKIGGISPELFVVESTKSDIVNLHNLAQDGVLDKVTQGALVQMSVEGPRLIVNNRNGEYLGEVEPKHSSRLVKLIKGGNEYAAAILSVEADKVQVIIKEEYQHPDQIGIPSFPAKITGSPSPRTGEEVLDSVVTQRKEVVGGAEFLEDDVEDSEEALPDGFSVVEDFEGRREIET